MGPSISVQEIWVDVKISLHCKTKRTFPVSGSSECNDFPDISTCRNLLDALSHHGPSPNSVQHCEKTVTAAMLLDQKKHQ